MRISKNVDFPQVKLIFSRVWAIKIEPKSRKNRSWRLQSEKKASPEPKNASWRPKIASRGRLEAILEAKRAILETENSGAHVSSYLLTGVGGMAEAP